MAIRLGADELKPHLGNPANYEPLLLIVEPFLLRCGIRVEGVLPGITSNPGQLSLHFSPDNLPRLRDMLPHLHRGSYLAQVILTEGLSGLLVDATWEEGIEARVSKKLRENPLRVDSEADFLELERQWKTLAFAIEILHLPSTNTPDDAFLVHEFLFVVYDGLYHYCVPRL